MAIVFWSRKWKYLFSNLYPQSIKEWDCHARTNRSLAMTLGGVIARRAKPDEANSHFLNQPVIARRQRLSADEANSQSLNQPVIARRQRLSADEAIAFTVLSFRVFVFKSFSGKVRRGLSLLSKIMSLPCQLASLHSLQWTVRNVVNFDGEVYLTMQVTRIF